MYVCVGVAGVAVASGVVPVGVCVAWEAMVSVLVRWRTARKPHRCAFCQDTIEPGERYASVALPPGDGDIGNDVWWHQSSHGEDIDACPKYWLNDHHPYIEYPEIMRERAEA